MQSRQAQAPPDPSQAEKPPPPRPAPLPPLVSQRLDLLLFLLKQDVYAPNFLVPRPSSAHQQSPSWLPRLLKFRLKPRHLPLGMFGIGLHVSDTSALAVGFFTP
jgi:hypothetical protein